MLRGDELTQATVRLPELRRAVDAQAETVDALRSREREARDQMIAARQRVETCDRLVEERERRLAEEKKGHVRLLQRYE